jgi:sortase A
LFVYRVTTLSEVRPDQTDVLGPTEDNRLTLITSAPRYGASGRLVATASLVGAPAKAALTAAPVIPADETGLSGQPWALAPLLLWTEVLLMALIGGVWLARRTAPRVGWLLGAPIAVAMIWAMYVALARLLPATI